MTGRQPTSEELGRRIEAGQNMARLVEDPAFQDLVDAFDERRQRILHTLELSTVTNAPDNAAHYASAIGEARGFKAIRTVANEVIARGRKAEELLRQDKRKAS